MITIASPFPASHAGGEKSSATWMSNLPGNRPACHILFWFFVFGFNAAYISFIGEDRDVSLFNLGLRIPFILACCYINLYWLLPRFYHTGKLFPYIGLVLFTIFSLNAINLYFLELAVDTPICPTTYEADATFNGSNYVYKGFYLFCLVGLTSGIKLSKDHFAERQRAETIEKEKLRTELSLLRSQINPHFFFNTLNNLYALTMKQSEQAPEMVLKLSDLMSYSLYEADGTQVSLDKEIKHVRNYIELETVRLGGKMDVEFTISGSTEGRQIPPLLFLPLIENCFKHSAVNKNGKTIRIELIVLSHTIALQTNNPAVADSRTLNKKGGIGLRNLVRRLELLFGDQYRLKTSNEEGLYSVQLEIPAV